jgi:glycyl-tRNA synthetase
MAHEETKMEKIISLAKRRGFVFQGSEIYGGLAGTWDYGPLGVSLKNNIRSLWWKRFVLDRDDMYGTDAAILMNQNVWKASGHVAGFSDPLVECKKCRHRFRADQLDDPKKCPDCEGQLGEPRQFNMMFKTTVGPVESEDSISYLRPETAQGMFVNFKNVLDTFHPKLPFGMAQIGKAFRNEIAPRDFVFRSREFEQMEIEYFVNPKEWETTFEHFVKQVHAFTSDVGLEKKHVHELEIEKDSLAHYSKRTIDFEFDFPFGKKELYGLAYRTDFDLKQHSEFSKVDLSYYDEETKERFIPHCIEPSFGLDRTILAVLSDAYMEDTSGEEPRVYMKFSPKVAPVKVAVFPLLKNKPQLIEKAQEIYKMLKKEISAVTFDDNGNIGKRYRRQDEIGTPYCVTVDFETIEKDAGVTVRDRDTGAQERMKIEELIPFLKSKIN